MLNNKIYNCIQTMDKITPYKLFNTKFTIGSNAFSCKCGGAGGWRYSLLPTGDTIKFFPLDTVRDSLLVRKEEFVQDNKAN